MKPYYILIAFAFANVAIAFIVMEAYYTKEHKKQVVITNNHIQKAFVQDKLHIVIKDILCGTEYSMVAIAFMLVVPERIDYNSVLQLRQYIKYQTDMQEKIFRVAAIDVPDIDPGYNFNNYSLSNLGQERRLKTEDIVNRLIFYTIYQLGADFNDYKHTCRLIGLFRSITNPDLYIKSSEVGDLDTCTLTAVDNSVWKYRSIDGRIWQVNTNQVYDPITTLSSQVWSVMH